MTHRERHLCSCVREKRGEKLIACLRERNWTVMERYLNEQVHGHRKDQKLQ